MKTPVIKKDDYIVYFENHEGYTFIHCDCHRWSRDVKHSLTKDFDVLFSVHGAPVYALHDQQDNKHLKFLTMFKFKYLMDNLCTDGIVRQIFVRVANTERKV